MDVAERREQLAGELLGGRRLAAPQPVGEVAALDVLHHQVRPRAGVVVVDRDQVRMLEPGGHSGLAAEAAEVVVLGGQGVGEHLDRDEPPEALVGGQPDHRHAAVSEPALEQVTAAEPAPGRDRRRLAPGRPSSGRPAPPRSPRSADPRTPRPIPFPVRGRANPGNASPGPPRVGTDHESHDHQLHPEALPRALEHRGAGLGRRRGAARPRRRHRDHPRGRPRAQARGRDRHGRRRRMAADPRQAARLRDPRDRDPDLARAGRRASPSGCSSGWTRCSPRPTTRAGPSPTTGSRAWS